MKITKENYFSKEAGMEYISVSQFKSFDGCEAKGMAKLNGEYDEFKSSKALDLGKYFHAWGEGKEAFAEFKENNKGVIYKKRGSGKLKEYVELDKTIELLESKKDQYKNFMKVIRNDNVQHEVIVTAELFGAKFKIMIDCYAPDLGWFADLKLMKSITDKFWSQKKNKYVGFIENYSYDLQMIVYSEVEKIAFRRNKPLDPILAVVTKEEVPDVALYHGFNKNQNYRKSMLEYVEKGIERIVDLKAGKVKPIRCEKCGWCKITSETKVFNFLDIQADEK